VSGNPVGEPLADLVPLLLDDRGDLVVDEDAVRRGIDLLWA
jgi:hypothetical protein